MNWLEVSLLLDGELAESAADVLSRYAHQGVAIESTRIETGPDDDSRPAGPVRLRAYLPADDAETLKAARARLEQDLYYLGRIRPIPPPTYAVVPETDWAELWKAHYHPIRTGDHLVIIPAWLSESYARHELRAGDIPILMDPGMAFGTGAHPTTQLCLSLLENYVKPGDAVCDIGCGSGILSVAAVKLGARRVLAVDIDPVALPAARENARLNHVTENIEVRLGSLELLRRPAPLVASDPDASSPASTLRVQPPTFDVAVANILARIIIKFLNEGLRDILTSGGTLIVSGILAEQAGQVIAGLHEAGLAVVEQRQDGDWTAFAAKTDSA